MRAEEQAEQIQLHHPLPLLDRRVLRRSEQHHAGVVHERIEPTQLPHRRLDHGGRLLPARQVGLNHERATALLLQIASEPLEPILPPGGERDCGTLRG